MKVIVAPDSFKGSISSKDLCSAIALGIKNVFPDANVLEIPMADGGEGTMENLVYATDGKVHSIKANDPLGREIEASYGVLGDGQTAIIEMAQASGLPSLTEAERNPLITSSFGTGQLILDALDKGYRSFIIGLGGSATNDGGTGMLKALGVKFLNNKNEELEDNVASLKELSYIDLANIDDRIKASKFIVASDVSNPLCGKNGASHIFGPQKGATPEMVQLLDSSLNKYGEIIHQQLGINVLEIPGAGAAGGMGAALIAFFNAEVNSGIDITVNVTQLQELIKAADIVITGEGKFDSQTLSGKVIAGVSKVANREKVPVIVLCGTNELKSYEMDELGVVSAFSLVPGPCTLNDSVRNAHQWVIDRTEQIMRMYKLINS
ncbi:glycerate kinase [Anaerobacillus isosaccharinicus]|uniref:Glycerate kinase n=1 Tax=Anaerobacillus isosaccharinicus TaxID=1532552 RepID=A0A1S2LNQ0_9BACI|nr:glycerate kinase [Anaerobacillus isosaccharinicus]MBA5587579.1 glycerate kinase [Anaerobacillus isosaccharinicus]QOY34244.1 glycerate kinase [Anaerobacillus isosaccharinicus]